MSDRLKSIEPSKVAGVCGERALATVRNMVTDEADLVAYAIVGVFADGRPFVGVKTEWPQDFPCNRHMFVGMATELIRDALITEDTACDVVNRANGFDD